MLSDDKEFVRAYTQMMERQAKIIEQEIERMERESKALMIGHLFLILSLFVIAGVVLATV